MFSRVDYNWFRVREQIIRTLLWPSFNQDIAIIIEIELVWSDFIVLI
jgi:hypothetical protein